MATNWTPEEDDKLRSLVMQRGMPYWRMAEHIGRTTESCKSRARRLGLSAAAPRPQPWNKGKSKAAQVEYVGLDAADGFSCAEIPVTAISLAELEVHHCRWPLWEDGQEHLFCGGDALEGRPYCARHFRGSVREWAR